MTDNNLLAFITTKIIKLLSQNYDYYLKAPNISRKLITFHIKNKTKQSSIAIQSTFSPPFRHEFPHPIHPSSTQSLSAPTFKQKYPSPHTAPNSPGTPFRPTQQIASIHPARSIAPFSTQHRLTLHAASPHTPRCIAPHSTLHKSSLFQVHVSPSSRRLSRPSSPSCPVCCDVIATCPRFPPASCLLSALPAPSALLPAFSRPVCCDAIATCPCFPSACIPLCPRFPSACPPPA